MVHDSCLVQDGGCLPAVNGTDRAEVIPNASNGDWYWPQSALLENGKLVVFSTRVRRTGLRSMDFRTVGTDAAVFVLLQGRPVFNRMAGSPSTGLGDGGLEYGADLVLPAAFTSVYGTRKVPGGRVVGRAGALARAPPGRPLQGRPS